ncbi:MAG: DUF3822 family protein [Rikenellaceae bacterium]|nr:DUF3822 family protein [Rikenellaceae bacterium]
MKNRYGIEDKIKSIRVSTNGFYFDDEIVLYFRDIPDWREELRKKVREISAGENKIKVIFESFKTVVIPEEIYSSKYENYYLQGSSFSVTDTEVILSDTIPGSVVLYAVDKYIYQTLCVALGKTAEYKGCLTELLVYSTGKENGNMVLYYSDSAVFMTAATDGKILYADCLPLNDDDIIAGHLKVLFESWEYSCPVICCGINSAVHVENIKKRFPNILVSDADNKR